MATLQQSEAAKKQAKIEQAAGLTPTVVAGPTVQNETGLGETREAATAAAQAQGTNNPEQNMNAIREAQGLPPISYGSEAQDAVASTDQLRAERDSNKLEATNLMAESDAQMMNDLSGQVNYAQATGSALTGDAATDAVLALQSFGETEQGQQMMEQINTLNEQIASGTLSAEEQLRVQAEVDATKAQYDQLIAEADRQKQQGMAKNLVAAGQRGGLMNTQFAGIAALMPTVGGNFVGAGGELNRIQSEYDLNISNLKAQKLSAVVAAEEAAREAIKTGRKEDLDAAIVAYDMARTANEDYNNIVREKADAISAFETKQLELQAYERETAGQTIDAMVASGVSPDEIPGYYFDDLDKKSGYPPGTTKGLMEVAIAEQAATSVESEIAQAQKMVDLLNDLPVGATIDIGGQTYSSLNKGEFTTGTETDVGGNMYLWKYNKDTGEMTTEYIGNFGNQKYTDVKSNEGAIVRVFEDGTQRIMFDPRQLNGGYAQGGLVEIFPEGSTSPFTRPNDPTGDIATECGAFVNDLTGLGVGNSLESKLAKTDSGITSENARIGDVFVQAAGTTGHIGIINGISTVNGETYYTVTESNWSKDPNDPTIGLVTHTRQIKASEVLGYARPGFKNEAYNFGTDALDIEGLTFGDVEEADADLVDSLTPAQLMDAYDKGFTSENDIKNYARIIAGGGDVKAKTPPTQGQSQAYSFAIRLTDAEKNIDRLEDTMSGGGGIARQAFEEAKALVVGGQESVAYQTLLRGNKSKEWQQSVDAFIRANLRRESGATITADEYRQAYQSYIPVPGDSESVVLQKKSEREKIMQGTITEAAPAFEYSGVEIPTIRVRDVVTGVTGNIPYNEYDPGLYERIY